MQIWMRLSRYQRYLLLLVSLMAMGLIYHYWGASSATHSISEGKRIEEVVQPDPLFQDAVNVDANVPESKALVDENALEYKRYECDRILVRMGG